ncbi:MAG: inositol monophosphatase [Bdellovibrionaceae bacterium]|nr:inositol monophosphatase [Pseudobdellovibrionaceae bacterium]MBX3034361.1 inositol monophosphatase [Pseudobdellovibrionaceae bacterium]
MENSAFPDDWRGALGTALRACRQGREVLLGHFGRLEHVESKFQAGLVSEADRHSEEVIISVLKKAYPHSEVLGEESTHAGTKVRPGRAGPQGRWILDPLDGTTNYIHRFPVFCISLALEVAGDLKVAVIDVPMLGETYTAIRGEGAFVNGKPLRVSGTARFPDSLLATGFFPDDKTALKEQIDLFARLVGEVRGVRRAGAAAYDLCQVARGVFDGFWEKNLKPWDVAAGQLLVEEAGGVVMTYSGGAHDPYSTSLVAGNEVIAPEIVRRISGVLT